MIGESAAGPRYVSATMAAYESVLASGRPEDSQACAESARASTIGLTTLLHAEAVLFMGAFYQFLGSPHPTPKRPLLDFAPFCGGHATRAPCAALVVPEGPFCSIRERVRTRRSGDNQGSGCTLSSTVLVRRGDAADRRQRGRGGARCHRKCRGERLAASQRRARLPRLPGEPSPQGNSAGTPRNRVPKTQTASEMSRE